MYRTGDLCRFAPDGASVHLGRIDRQLKVRGLRLEPAEVESVLVSHPAVTDCAVVVGPDSARLVAFVVLADGAGAGEDDTTAALTGFAADLLPAHGVPEVIVPVAELPITVNGKLDTAALLARLPSAEQAVLGRVPGADMSADGSVWAEMDEESGAHRGRHLRRPPSRPGRARRHLRGSGRPLAAGLQAARRVPDPPGGQTGGHRPADRNGGGRGRPHHEEPAARRSGRAPHDMTDPSAERRGPMRYGIMIVPEDRWSRAREKWRRTEALGFDHAWTYDHLNWRAFKDRDWFTSVPTLAAAAVETTRIAIEVLVASPNLRHPVQLAKDMTTIADIAGAPARPRPRRGR